MRSARAVIFAVSLALLLGSVLAYAADEAKTRIVTKEVSGEIGGISSNFIAVVYGYAGGIAQEMALNMAKDVRTSGRKVAEIGLGDIVKVIYEETIETGGDQKPRVIKREAKLIEFQRQASRKPDEETSTTLVSQEQ
ncbi:MAG: hypothetical protein PHR11_04160 [Candidatus Omnitrophica bacterium]|nr:hypothetical protein [Candidatus Omnitrophota bacterium]